MSDEKFIEIEDGNVYISEDAPDDFVEAYDKNERLMGSIIEYAILLAEAYDDTPAIKITNYLKHSDKQIELMHEAVDDGDIDEAQKRKWLAEEFERVGEKYFEAI